MAPEAFQWLSRPMLADIREKSEAATVRTPAETPHSMRVIGTRKQVRPSVRPSVNCCARSPALPARASDWLTDWLTLTSALASD